jgi:isorenieratene synthase
VSDLHTDDVGPFSRVASALTAMVGAAFRLLVVWPFGGLARRWIRRRLAGYKIRVNLVDTLKPARPEGDAPRVLVVGAGLAGISAASALGERGFHVELVERNAYLGGKLGAWTETFADGEQHGVEHGFHAFFGSYYNLMRFIDRIGARSAFRKVDDYRILTLDGEALGFADLEPTPWLNMAHIVWRGVFDWRDFVVHPQHRLLDVLGHYERDATYAALDDVSFDRFARQVALPGSMRLMFNTFSRAFFARAEQMSMAALIRSFHLFYLSNEAGLVYEHPTDDHARVLLDPMRRHLERHGVRVRTETPVQGLTRLPDGRILWSHDGQDEVFDDVVIATDAKALQRIVGDSPIGRESPALLADLAKIAPQNRYANLRVWFDRDDQTDHPVFTVTEKRRALDSISFYHRCEATSAAWAQGRGGGAVLELHAYQVPEDLQDEAAIREALLDDLFHVLPSLRGATLLREHMQLRDDFSPFFVGMERHRPRTDSGLPRVWFAGDWVKLPVPAMLMEGAFTSGLYAANAILTRHGLREEPIYSVPLRGLMLGND